MLAKKLLPENESLPSPVDVAAAVIETRPGLDQMQLHKLLYLIQAAHLAWFKSRAFRGRIEAWKWGPMVRRVAGTYMQYERDPIPKPLSGKSQRLGQRTRWVIDRVLSDFGDRSGLELAALTKAEGTPWRVIRGDLPEDTVSRQEIPKELIEEYHSKFGLVAVEPTDEEIELALRFLDGDKEAFAALFEKTTGSRPTVH